MFIYKPVCVHRSEIHYIDPKLCLKRNPFFKVFFLKRRAFTKSVADPALNLRIILHDSKTEPKLTPIQLTITLHFN